MAPTLYCETRLPVTTYLYDDADHPDRVTRTIAPLAFTAEDHALLEALESWEASLCRCGYPREEAWHSDNDGWYEGHEYVCQACTARAGSEVVYTTVSYTRPHTTPLPPFQLGVTTTKPSKG